MIDETTKTEAPTTNKLRNYNRDYMRRWRAARKPRKDGRPRTSYITTYSILIALVCEDITEHQAVRTLGIPLREIREKLDEARRLGADTAGRLKNAANGQPKKESA